ncbi:OadG family protein [Ferrovibrio sp.]|uniref:OadG family protein n=1 Tax=Ferrovibrio sp. TaxID=1917215 RepID=UPI003D0D4C7F
MADQDTDPRLRWLKPLVIGLSVVFVALIMALIVGLITGVPQRRAEAAKQTAKPVPANLSPAFAEQVLNLPRNSRVADVFASGERIIVRVRLADGTERLFALHSQTLQPIGQLTIQVEK